MRFLFRIAVLALAALGAKTLYDRVRPAVEGATSGSGSSTFEPAKSAAREVAEHAKAAAGEVAQHARTAASDVAAQTRDQLRESTGDSSTGDSSNASATSP